MTRTNRAMSEPPILDGTESAARPVPPELQAWLAEQIPGQGGVPRMPRHGYGPIAGLAILIASAAPVVGIGYVALEHLAHRAPVAPIAAKAAPDEIACRAPERPGEQLAVFFRHDAGRVVWRCISSRDWDVMPPAAKPDPKDWRPM